MLKLAELARALEPDVSRQPVPLLVLRVPQFERVAWRHGQRAARRLERAAAGAFARCARNSLRAHDHLAHDPGSDIFAAAIVGPPREAAARQPAPGDCRAALERIAAGMSAATELPVESGWTLVRALDAAAGLEPDITLALERGLRERERYEFFATVGHELRTPLASIRGYLETVLEQSLDADTSRRFLETAQRETLRLGRLVDTMFEFSLLDLCATALGTASCDLRDVIGQACDIVAPAAGRRGIRIVNAAVAVFAGNARIEQDAALQAVVNLLDNAVKYGRSDGIVRAGLRIDGPYARICIDDDGPGVAAADREKIFGLRVRAARAQRPGSGIGLAIVRMIAERAGGDVAVADSTLGGARFELLLPLEAESAAAVS